MSSYYVTFAYPSRIVIDGAADIYARYKMGQLSIRHYTKGGTKKTYLDNVSDVCKDLKVPVEHLVYYLANKLGSLQKRDQINYYLCGHHDCEPLDRIMKEYIRRYVLCSVCDLPELDFKCLETGIELSCRACGGSRVIKVDKKELKACSKD